MDGHLTRLSYTPKSGYIRTPGMDGFFKAPPSPGTPFRFFGAPLDPDASLRILQTSTVKDVHETPTGWEFTTTSGSKYSLEKVEDLGESV